MWHKRASELYNRETEAEDEVGRGGMAEVIRR